METIIFMKKLFISFIVCDQETTNFESSRCITIKIKTFWNYTFNEKKAKQYSKNIIKSVSAYINFKISI